MTGVETDAVASSGSGGVPRHWPAFFVKICSASQPCATVRSTARLTPPATDMCAPMRSICACSHKIDLVEDG